MPQNAKLRLLELHYFFSTKFCDMNKFEVGDGHKFPISCSCREGVGRLYLTRNENKIGAPAVEGLYQ